MSAKKIDDVIEQHRLLIGADRVRVDLGPSATAENVEEALEGLRAIHEEWESYPETLRLKAQISQLEDRLHRIAKLSQTNVKALQDQHPDVTAIKKAIFRETDCLSIHLDTALRFCREKSASLP